MNSKYLGIDTSNYTTSCAVYNPSDNTMDSVKQLLPVREGQIGLRQSDAVFHHSRNLPLLLSSLLSRHNNNFSAVSASYAPRDAQGSYMPCFCVGEGYGKVLASAFGAEGYNFSHQAGHIAAALWASGRTELVEREFIAFHISGGTTDVLHIKPDSERVFSVDMIASSLDLKAGQAVDRVGAMLGLKFPAGPQLDLLAKESEKKYKIRPYQQDGSCSFSGVQNKCELMLKNGENKCDIARYCIEYVYSAVKTMTESALLRCGDLPIIYAGGVMSNSIINERLSSEFAGTFVPAEYSSDNAAGIAYLGYIREIRK